jgi:hypothetical protein
MYGIGQRYAGYAVEPFKLPETLDLKDCQIRNETHFMEFLIRNDWIQRLVGIKMSPSNGFFPDLCAEIYDESGEKIRVEAEYRAENYAAHGHSYRGCDLILSFIRKPEVRFIKGIPVWSFYEQINQTYPCELSLYDDIAYDFYNHDKKEEKLSELLDYDKPSESYFNLKSRPQAGRVSYAIGECVECGNPVSQDRWKVKYCSTACKSASLSRQRLVKNKP